jgi:hypothetical protein
MSTELHVGIHVECPLLLSKFYQNYPDRLIVLQIPNVKIRTTFNASGVKVRVTYCLPHNSIILTKYSALHNNIKNDDFFGPCRSSSVFICYRNINRDVYKVYITKICKRRLLLRICRPGSLELLRIHMYITVTQQVSFSCFGTPTDRRDSDFNKISKLFNCF